jgi:hypothetical protein
VDESAPAWFQELLDEGLITGNEMQLKSGKEAKTRGG